jgi:hypothetical protein
LSEVGFEPTPTFVDQNTQSTCIQASLALESGALDHSAILTLRLLRGVGAQAAYSPRRSSTISMTPSSSSRVGTSLLADTHGF